MHKEKSAQITTKNERENVGALADVLRWLKLIASTYRLSLWHVSLPLPLRLALGATRRHRRIAFGYVSHTCIA